MSQIKPLPICGQEIIIIPKLARERVGMVLKAAEYYLTNLAQERSGKSGKNDTQIM